MTPVAQPLRHVMWQAMWDNSASVTARVVGQHLLYAAGDAVAMISRGTPYHCHREEEAIVVDIILYEVFG